MIDHLPDIVVSLDWPAPNDNQDSPAWLQWKRETSAALNIAAGVATKVAYDMARHDGRLRNE